ncbi:MAG TPA: serine protease [Vitreimonas sp.]|nr:serine protease [Vitreimonas sp.]
MSDAAAALLRSLDRRLIAVGGAVVGGLLVLAIVLGTSGSGDAPRLPGAGSEGLDLEALKRGTVLISGQRSNPTSWGSGTIISSDGLILTNAHVAQNRAPGLGVLFKGPIELSLGPQVPDTLYIHTIEGDEPAVATWRARVLAADGYLDLAVLQVTADADGRPVEPGELDLPAVPLGTSRDLPAGSDIHVLGFPGIAQSLRVHVTRGVLSNFSDDPRVGPKGWINTDAKISPGNSGGLGAHGGRLVGIPDRREFEETGGPEIEYVMRPVETALDLIEAARTGKEWDPYTYVVKHSGSETAEVLGWSGTEGTDCTSTSTEIPVGATTIRAQVNLSGMVPGDHLYVALLTGDGDDVSMVGAYPFDWPPDAGSSGCFNATFSAPSPFREGDYGIGLLVGANYEHAVPIVGRNFASIGTTGGTAESPVDEGGLRVQTCSETSPDRWASPAAVIDTPEMPFPGDQRDRAFGYFTGQLTPAGGVATLEEADQYALNAMGGNDFLSTIWYVLRVDGRFHAYSGAIFKWITPQGGIVRDAPCRVDRARYQLVAFHSKSFVAATMRTLRYDFREGSGAAIADVATGEVVWRSEGGGVGPTPGPTAPPVIPTTPGPAADAWLLTEVSTRSGPAGCRSVALDGSSPVGAIAQVLCEPGPGYDFLTYYLFGDRLALNAHVDLRREQGHGNATQACDGADTWIYTDTPNVERGKLVCSSLSVEGGPVAQIHWTETDHRIAGFVENRTSGGDTAALWTTWKSSGIYEAPR